MRLSQEAIKEMSRLIADAQDDLTLTDDERNLLLYFLRRSKNNPYIIDHEKSKKAIRGLFIEHPRITLDDWKACVDWAFGDGRKTHHFWSKVSIYSFTTLIKMYNSFQSGRTQSPSNPVIDYGRKR